MRKLKVLLVLAVGLLPASRVKNTLLNRLGHDIAPTARIAPILLLRVRKLRVGPGTLIGFGNKLRGLRMAEFGEETKVGPRNDFRASAAHNKESDEPEYVGVLKVGDVVFISKRHEVDCTGGVLIDDWSGLAGRGIFIYSHSYDPRRNVNTCGPTRIGRNAMVASRTILAMGATLPEGSVLAMGAVLMPGASKTHAMYGGVPARAIKEDIGDWAFQHRTTMAPRVQKGFGVAGAEMPEPPGLDL